jgi:hypothetical protein
MSKPYGWIAVLFLAVVALQICGCPALMIPSLGYQAYKYHETGHLPGMPSSSETKSEKKATPARTPGPNEIE